MRLNTTDVASVLRHLPAAVRAALQQEPGRRFLAGGFIRAIIAQETPNDVDLFVTGDDAARALAKELKTPTPAVETGNAISIDGHAYKVQIIHRWTFATPHDCVKHFDFTVCAAAVWWDGVAWDSTCDAAFYSDLAAKRLMYRHPTDPEPGGSMLRLLKFAARGYVAPPSSIAAIVARLAQRPSAEARICADIAGAYGEHDDDGAGAIAF